MRPKRVYWKPFLVNVVQMSRLGSEVRIRMKPVSLRDSAWECDMMSIRGVGWVRYWKWYNAMTAQFRTPCYNTKRWHFVTNDKGRGRKTKDMVIDIKLETTSSKPMWNQIGGSRNQADCMRKNIKTVLFWNDSQILGFVLVDTVKWRAKAQSITKNITKKILIYGSNCRSGVHFCATGCRSFRG